MKNPQLEKFTMVAKKIIYEPGRMKKFLKMLGTKQGAMMAAQTVIAAIEKLRPIPPEIKGLLAVNAYMIMVDVAQEVMEVRPDPAIVKEVVGSIMQSYAAAPQQAAPQAGAPTGLIAQGA